MIKRMNQGEKIMDDLSSNYSVYVVNSYNINKNEESKNNKNSDINIHIKKKEIKQEKAEALKEQSALLATGSSYDE